MLRLDTVDFEACPGSGKTTLMVAKLAILATRWPHRQQGICVLSHTNAARNEISTKLSNSAAGLALMRYPHFIGTIHSFVNEYLAVPWLRSKGVEVRCIDTEIAVLKRWNKLSFKTRLALERSGVSPYALTYTAPDYAVGTVGRFAPHTITNQAMIEVNRVVSEQGYFCFDEMFVWAKELLDQRPETAASLRQRFPLVFIDEAQDNSEAQSALLYQIFCEGDAPSRRQRFGDSNQAIYSSSNQRGANTDCFPGAVVHTMPRSYRFGQIIADRVKGLGVTPQDLIGTGPPNHFSAESQAPALFLFDDASVQAVLGRYGEHLINIFDAETLNRGTFTAVAGVHHLDVNGRIPHAIGHYFPSYDPACTRKETAPKSFVQHLARARFETADIRNTDKLVNATAAALLAAAELASGIQSHIARKSPHRQIVEMLGDREALANYVALQEMVLMRQGVITPATWTTEALTHIEAVVRQLGGVTQLNGDVARFLAAPQPEAISEVGPAITTRADNMFAYPADAPKVHVRLSSIHSVKGETHTATLVLDSFFHSHHLSELKPWLMGTKSGGSSTNRKGRQVFHGPRILGRLKLHYVGMTRPTHLLCLAMRKDAFDEGEIDTLEGLGWKIIDCCTPDQA